MTSPSRSAEALPQRPVERVRAIAMRLLRERATPARLAWAVGFGVLIGTTPFYGLHLGITLVVATILGLNRAVTYLAANVSLPFMAPFLAFASIQIGTVLLTGRPLGLSLEALHQLGPWTFGGAWLLGSLVLGTALGIPAGTATYFLVGAYRRRHPLPVDPTAALFARVAIRYADVGRFEHGYVRGKLRHDPVFRQLVDARPFRSPVLDVGCGRGQTVVVLAVDDPTLEALGLDWEEAKLATARRAAADLPQVRFTRVDVREAAFPPSATIFLIDVLHYNPIATQDRILQRAARALTPGGALYIRDVDDAAGWRATINRWQERAGRLVGLNRGATLCFRPIAEVRALLESEGLAVATVPSSTGLPLANVLLVARRA